MYRILLQIFRTGFVNEPAPAPDPEMVVLGHQLDAAARRIYGRSLAIRHVDSGSCNLCEQEINALHNPLYNLEGLGFHFVASPRHADLLLITGPVTRNMEGALRDTYDAMPVPRLVVATGSCARDGGIFGCTYATIGGVDKVLPVDVYIPGCPPDPRTLIQGLLSAVNGTSPRVEDEQG